MAKKINTSSKSVDSNQPNFLNFRPKTKREKDLYNQVNGRLQEFAAADPEYADAMESSNSSTEYTIPTVATPQKQQEVVPQEPEFSKKEIEEKIQSEVKSEVQREVQKVVAQEVQKEIQRIVPQEVQKAVEKIVPKETPKAVKEEVIEDFEEPKTEKLFIENNEPEVSEPSNFQENDSDEDSYDRMKRIILIIVFIGLLAAVIFFALRRCTSTPNDGVVIPDTTMQQAKPVEKAPTTVAEPQAKKSVSPGMKIEDLKGSTTKSTKKDANVVQQPKKAVATETKATQSKTTDVASTKKSTTSTKEAAEIPTMAAEPTKTEPIKEVEPVKVTEPVKITEIKKPVEPAKVEPKPAEVAAPKQEPETVIAKDLPFQEKNSKPKQTTTAPVQKPATTAPAAKPKKAPVKVEITKSTTDDLKELEKQKESGPRICTPDKVPTEGYLISYSSTKNESTAIKTVMILTRNQHFPCGYYWLGDSKTQKKSSLFRVFIGPYKTEAEAQAAIPSIQGLAPDAKVYTEIPTKK